MTKTLFSAEERKNAMEMPKYKKVTATKVIEIESNVQNLYKDEAGNKYIVKYNKFQKRNEFVKIG